MRKFAHTMITLPLLVVAWQAARAAPVSAEPFGPLAAVELLAKTRAADRKCNYLNDAEAQELSDYVARGELAAAQQTTVGETERAIAAGRKDGQAAACGSNGADDVKATLLAAREAMAAVGKDEPEAAPVKPNRAAEASRPDPVSPPRSKAVRDDYEGEAFAYYLDRRCNHLSRAQAKRFYAAIVRAHESAMAARGKRAIATLLRRAEADAKATACGAQSAALVRDGFARAVN